MGNYQTCSIEHAHLVQAYLYAKQYICARGFATEIEWQDAADLDCITEASFLREAGWVIISAGMRESVVRQLFSRLSAAFLDWKSAKSIVARRRTVRTTAMRVFAHGGKIDAILEIAKHISDQGFMSVAEHFRNEGPAYLQDFAYLGPATSFHLAKNLGFAVSKPDRHLVRIAAAAGYDAVDAMCRDIGRCAGDKESVVDLVMWRFATLHGGYCSLFKAVLKANALN